MKKLLLAFVPALLLASTIIVPAAKAQDTFPTMEVTMKLTLTPFNLAYLAYHGYFESQGIPQYSNLAEAFRSGKTTATQVVKAAVDTKRLPDSFLKNDSYIKALSIQLFAFSTNH